MIGGTSRDIAKQNLAGRLAFTGIHVISPELLSRIPEGVFYDIILCYQKLIASGNTRSGRSFPKATPGGI